MSDDELAMAYADGELDALSARRFERRLAEEPALAAAVEAQRAVAARVRGGFAGVAEAPVPARLASLLETNVVAFPQPARAVPRWRSAAAMAACLVGGLAIGHFRQAGPVAVSGGQLVASGTLAKALDGQLASDQGNARMLVSFRDASGAHCRVFANAPVSGIACREEQGWVLRQTQAGEAKGAGEYRQAGSAEAALMAAAQEMMAGEPLDAEAERAARARGWR